MSNPIVIYGPCRRLLSRKEKLARRQAEERGVKADVVSIRVLNAEREDPKRDEEQNGWALTLGTLFAARSHPSAAANLRETTLEAGSHATREAASFNPVIPR